MRMPRQARRLSVLSASGRDKQYGKVGPGTMGAFAGPVRPQPSC